MYKYMDQFVKYSDSNKHKLCEFEKKVKQLIQTEKLCDDSVQLELLDDVKRLKIKSNVGVIFGRRLFTDNIIGEIEKYKKLLKRFAQNDDDFQFSFLRGLEQTLFIYYKLIMKRTDLCEIMKKLYDTQIIQKNIICCWNAYIRTKYTPISFGLHMREEIQPFIEKLIHQNDIDEEEEEYKDEYEPDENFRNLLLMLNKINFQNK